MHQAKSNDLYFRRDLSSNNITSLPDRVFADQTGLQIL